LNINTQTIGSTTTIFLQGKFDGTIRKKFNDAVRDAVAQPSASKIEVHLGGADYIDSAACGMLLLLKKMAEDAGKSVYLTSAKGSVKHVLDLMNFKQMFQII